MSSPTSAPGSRQDRRSAIAAVLGGSLEYYDFALFASAAAIVFPHVFYGDSQYAVLASFATFGVAYIARPLGAIVLSHVGDRFGRKKALILTISLMGVGTFLIGCLPSYDTAGAAAPILLIVLRLIQGFSAGGELAGASSLTMEHAPEGRRGFLSSFALVGVGIGMLLANAVMIPISALPDDILFSWGWRVPFLLSIVVLAVGLYIRKDIEEPAVFVDTTTGTAKRQRKAPLLEVFQYNWQGLLCVAAANLFAVVQTVTTVFGVAYGIQEGIDRTTMVMVATVGQAVSIPLRPLFGMVSDRFGRKPVFIVAALGSGFMILPYFAAISAGNVPALFAANVVLTGLFIGAADGAYPAFFSEQFSASMRYTGMAVGLQIGIVVSGFSPTLGSVLRGSDPANWQPVAIMTIVCTLIAVTATLLAKETYRTPLRELGLTPQLKRRLAAENTVTASPASTNAPARIRHEEVGR